MEYRAGEVLSLAVGFKCCWEANQGVEGSENAPEQLKAFCFSVRAQPRNRDSPHMAVGGKVQSRCVFVPVAAQSTSWTTRPEWCWTSWRRWATTCGRWRGWGRRWCGACTSGATRETQYSQRPYEIMKTENGAFGFSKFIDSLFFFFFLCPEKIEFLNWDYPRLHVWDYVQKVTGHWFRTSTHSSNFKRAFCTLCWLLFGLSVLFGMVTRPVWYLSMQEALPE